MEAQESIGIDITAVFRSQQLKALELKKSTAQERMARLIKLKEVLNANANNINEAIYNDFKKPKEETFADFDPIISEIDFVNAFLECWMKPEITTTPEALGGEASVSKIILEPKGVCLFLTPWNYPFLLTLRPLVACLAAGNTVIIKPSELTPHSSKLIKEIIESAFPEDEVFVIEGGAEVASELLDLLD